MRMKRRKRREREKVELRQEKGYQKREDVKTEEKKKEDEVWRV